MPSSMDGAAQQRLLAFLARVTKAHFIEIVELSALSGGAIQENWGLTVALEGGLKPGQHRWVLRKDAASGVAVSLGRKEEFALLRAAEEAGVTVPRPLYLCEDSSVLGTPFYIMARIEGVALGPKVVKDLSLGGDREALTALLGRELARIHSIVPPQPDLAFLEEAGEHPALRDIARYRAYLDEMGELRPALEWGLAWCADHLPAQQETVLVHQDFRTGNYMLDDSGLTGILDWEFCAWGDPMSDLGWFCAQCWRFGRPDLEAGGIGKRETFYQGYEEESGRTVDRDAVAFWEVMAHLRWAVIALQQGHRHIAGQQASLELALTGRMAAQLELAVLDMTSPERWGTAHA